MCLCDAWREGSYMCVNVHGGVQREHGGWGNCVDGRLCGGLRRG